jgi:hypothetical protein
LCEISCSDSSYFHMLFFLIWVFQYDDSGFPGLLLDNHQIQIHGSDLEKCRVTLREIERELEILLLFLVGQAKPTSNENAL